MILVQNLLLLVAIWFVAVPATGAETYRETRCCVDEIKRDAEGHIYRDQKAKREFRRRWPCPTGAGLYDACPGWQIDHVIPLACGGVDDVYNMQWLPVEIKTCADDTCKDRFERIIYC